MQKAFTLIEALLAIALAGMLMALLLSVSHTFSVSQKMQLRSADDSGEQWRYLQKALAWDLVNARQIATVGDTVVLQSLASLDPVSRSPRLRPVKVVYRSRSIGDTCWLVREQYEPGSPLGAQPWSDLVCKGIRRIQVVAQVQSSEDETVASASPPPLVRIVLVPELGIPEEHVLALW